MATATISLDDALMAQVSQAAGQDISAWIATACRSRLLSETARAALEWERSHPGEEAAVARAEEAARVLKTEAAQEIEHHAYRAAQVRGEDSGPTTADYLAAYRHVRALLERGEQQLRDQHRDPHDGE